ncbi:MAG TPA: serine/threonine-protein kinase, partial [Kofleriaceae bacterium]|nr:serine/threonine-protein kinase [Kofleriaceae bacterium]
MDSFLGTERFQLLARLGAGGMGVVYEALDRELDVRVALKALPDLHPDALLRFKNEFRALQDLHHPNLVHLGELFCEGHRWFFTMELVRGVDFLTWVRRLEGRGRAQSPAVSSGRQDITAPTVIMDSLGEVRTAPPVAADGERLRFGLRQLAAGLEALHGAGKIHRDIKPSNILVTEDGRLVLLDFGLIADVDHGGSDGINDVVGTAHYMAPEQAAGAPLGPEADWYSVGVVLFEALTARKPFAGTAERVLELKQRVQPPRPRLLSTDVDVDLDQLCTGLLHIDPAERRRALDGLPQVCDWDPSEGLSQPGGRIRFVGREPELAALTAAAGDSRRHAVTLLIEGESGVGKSALMRRFLDRVAGMPGAVALEGHCYEHESIPFKAVDGVIDALSQRLRALPAGEVQTLLPPGIAVAAQVFPVLTRVEAVARARQTAHGILDPVELRRRLFAAVRGLFGRLAEARTLVVAIDDLQWADADSLALLAELMRPPDAPQLLLVATVRSDLAATRPDGP